MLRSPIGKLMIVFVVLGLFVGGPLLMQQDNGRYSPPPQPTSAPVMRQPTARQQEPTLIAAGAAREVLEQSEAERPTAVSAAPQSEPDVVVQPEAPAPTMTDEEAIASQVDPGQGSGDESSESSSSTGSSGQQAQGNGSFVLTGLDSFRFQNVTHTGFKTGVGTWDLPAEDAISYTASQFTGASLMIDPQGYCSILTGDGKQHNCRYEVMGDELTFRVTEEYGESEFNITGTYTNGSGLWHIVFAVFSVGEISLPKSYSASMVTVISEFDQQVR